MDKDILTDLDASIGFLNNAIKKLNQRANEFYTSKDNMNGNKSGDSAYDLSIKLQDIRNFREYIANFMGLGNKDVI